MNETLASARVRPTPPCTPPLPPVAEKRPGQRWRSTVSGLVSHARPTHRLLEAYRRTAAGLLGASLILGTLTGLLAFATPEAFGSCLGEPTSFDSKISLPSWRDSLAFTGVHILLSLLLAAGVWRGVRHERVALLAFSGYMALMYVPGILIVEIAKRTVPDMACSRHGANAVSGHAFYAVWAMAVAAVAARILCAPAARAVPPGERVLPRRAAASATLGEWWPLLATAACIAPQLATTYLHGFHSLQQICYGVIAGCVYWGGMLLLWSEQHPAV